MAIDGFGNKVTMLYADGPTEQIAITVAGQVLTTESSGVVRGSHKPLPDGVFLRTTVQTQGSEVLAAFTGDALGQA